MPDWPVQTEEAVWEEHIYQFQLSDPLFGGPVIDPVTKQGIDNFPLVQLANRTKWLRSQLEDMQTTESFEVTVGTTGDFSTINSALAELSRMGVGYSPENVTATVRLLAGFVMEEQVFVNALNLGWMRIVGTDSHTVIARDALSENPPGDDGFPAFYSGAAGMLPVIAQLFEMSEDGSGAGRDGISVWELGSAVIAEGAGVRNAGRHGLLASQATIMCEGAVFRGAGERGIQATRSSIVAARNSDLKDAADVGARVWRGAALDCEGADISGGANGGVECLRGARLGLRSANARMGASDDPDDIVVGSGGIIDATNATGGTNVTPNEVTSDGIIFQ